jgi:hypothetical protein
MDDGRVGRHDFLLGGIVLQGILVLPLSASGC